MESLSPDPAEAEATQRDRARGRLEVYRAYSVRDWDVSTLSGMGRKRNALRWMCLLAGTKNSLFPAACDAAGLSDVCGAEGPGKRSGESLGFRGVAVLSIS